jgi:D-amino-acid dehydrogenase
MAILGPLDRLSLRCWEELLAATQIDCLWRRAGWMEVYASDSGCRQAEREAAMAERCGFRTEVFDRATLREREHACAAGVDGAVFYPEGCSLDPGRFIVSFADRLRAAGVTIRESTAIQSLRFDGARCSGIVLADGEVITGAETILAAGAWSTALARAAGVKLPMQAGKGYHLDLEAPHPVPSCGCVLVESSVAVTPMGDTLRLAGTLEFSGVNLKLHRHRVDMLRSSAVPYIRGVADAREQDAWCGLRPCIADGLPVIDRAPGLAGLFLATGHAKMGLTHGPGTGKLIAEWLTDGKPSLDLTLLRADRF